MTRNNGEVEELFQPSGLPARTTQSITEHGAEAAHSPLADSERTSTGDNGHKTGGGIDKHAFERPLFFPAFGYRPMQLIGREQAIGDLLDALASKPASRIRTLLVTGHKGMGKTALLREMADWAEAQGCIVLQTAPVEDVHAEALQLGMGKPLFITVDDVQYSTSGLRALVNAYLRLGRQGKQVVLALAGRPRALETALADSVLAPLAHGHRIRLEPLPLGKVQTAYSKAFVRCGVHVDAGVAEQAAAATHGHPFLLQLLGAHLLDAAHANDAAPLSHAALQQAISAAKADLPQCLYAPMLAGLSPHDMAFLHAMAVDGDAGSRIRDLRQRLDVADNYLQPYRTRLLRAGVITSPQRGRLAFALPYLGEYLAQQG